MTEREAVDQGADGPAMQRRPAEVVKVATGDKRRGREQAEVRRFEDTHPFDYYARTALLTDRQIDAGWALVKLHACGWPRKPVTASYGQVRAEDTTPDAIEAQAIAARAYAAHLDAAPAETRHALVSVMHGEFPTMCRGVWYLRVALDAIADRMKLPRVGV